MSITLDDLEELEAMSDFSDSMESSDAEEDHEQLSAASSDARSEFSAESTGTSAQSDDEYRSDLDSASYSSEDGDDAMTGHAASEASGGGSASSSDGSASDSNDDVGDGSADGTAVGVDSRAASDTQKQLAPQSHERPQYPEPEVSSDCAIRILAQTPFARSEADMDQLLEWVLSVKFFQDNARSSFVRDCPSFCRG